jgi:putative transposase
VFRTEAGLAAAVENRMHFYNPERMHSALGMRSPIDYEHTLKAATEAS